MTTRSIFGLLFSVGLCLGVAGTGAWVTRPAIPTWYADLAKPIWTPPNWVFGPVWTVLYIMMGIAAWMVWKQRNSVSTTVPLSLFFVQLGFNVAWSGIFFGLKMPGLAFLDIVLLWLTILATMVAFWRVTPTAGVLLLPYWLWVTYASALNFSIWRMNA